MRTTIKNYDRKKSGTAFVATSATPFTNASKRLGDAVD